MENHHSEPKEKRNNERLTTYTFFSFFSSLFKVELFCRSGDQGVFIHCLTVNMSYEVINLGNGLAKEDFVKFCFVSLVLPKVE